MVNMEANQYEVTSDRVRLDFISPSNLLRHAFEQRQGEFVEKINQGIEAAIADFDFAGIVKEHVKMAINKVIQSYSEAYYSQSRFDNKIKKIIRDKINAEVEKAISIELSKIKIEIGKEK